MSQATRDLLIGLLAIIQVILLLSLAICIDRLWQRTKIIHELTEKLLVGVQRFKGGLYRKGTKGGLK